MHISLAGRLGSGKSTLAKIFCPKYGFEHYYTGAIMRALAEERGMSALEFNQMCENDRSADYMIDNKTTEVSRARKNDKILGIYAGDKKAGFIERHVNGVLEFINGAPGAYSPEFFRKLSYPKVGTIIP